MLRLYRFAIRFFPAVLISCNAAVVLAQSNPLIDLYPPFEYNDVHGVDLASGNLRLHEELITPSSSDKLGVSLDLTSPGLPPISYCAGMNAGVLGQNIYTGLTANSTFSVTGTGSPTFLSYGQIARFNRRGWRIAQPDGSFLYPNEDGSSATMTLNPAQTEFSYVGVDGSIAKLSTSIVTMMPYNYYENYGTTTEFTFPDGEKLFYYYNTTSYRYTGSDCIMPNSVNLGRVKFIVSSKGYGIQFEYESDISPATNNLAKDKWYSITKITRYNKSTNYCNEPLLQTCIGLHNTIFVTLDYNRTSNSVNITYSNGETEKLSFDNGLNTGTARIIESIRGGISNTAKVFSYSEYVSDEETIHSVSSVTVGGKTWKYGLGTYVPGSPEGPHTVVNPDGSTLDFAIDSGSSTTVPPNRVWDSLGRHWYFTYTGPSYKPLTISLPENHSPTANPTNAQEFSYDTRGNRTQAKSIPKPGSGLTPIIWNAAYPANCVIPKTCNKPTSITDPRGGATSYTYDPVHGGTLTATGPAVGGVSSVTRYTYTTRRAWVSNGAGGYVQNAGDIYLLAGEKMCRTSATVNNTCSAGTSDEVATTYDYGPDSGPNNLWLRGKVVTADGISLRTCYGYDAQGNKVSETSPRAGLTVCP